MSVLVRCPECAKKLKVGADLLGRRVRCSCGNIFVATQNGADEAGLADPSKVVVACGECDTQLRVPTERLGKKMKCPSCGGIFIAALPAQSAPPLARPVGVGSDDDMMAYVDDDEPAAPHRGRPVTAFRDENGPAVPAARPPARPPLPPDDDDLVVEEVPDTGRPVKPARAGSPIINVLVLLLVIAYTGVFLSVWFGLVDLDVAPMASTRQKGGGEVKQGTRPAPRAEDEPEEKEGDDVKPKVEPRVKPPVGKKKGGLDGKKKIADNKLDETTRLTRPDQVVPLPPQVRVEPVTPQPIVVNQPPTLRPTGANLAPALVGPVTAAMPVPRSPTAALAWRVLTFATQLVPLGGAPARQGPVPQAVAPPPQP